ncbi:MAG: hypothetical protein LLG04_04775 [Parachlamydia sp.]|nr:hypothetical protein [Parachlamydia sp.]
MSLFRLSYGTFLVRGTSMQGCAYVFKNFENKHSAEIEKIMQMWNTFKSYSTWLLVASAGGLAAGAILLPEMALFGIAVVVASASLAILSAKRLLEASGQAKEWGQTTGRNDGMDVERARLCRQFYQSLVIPNENREQYAFLCRFFNSLANPMHGYIANGCRTDNQINAAKPFYHDLCLSFLSVRNSDDQHNQMIPNVRPLITRVKEERLALNRSILERFLQTMQVPAQRLKVQVIHDYIATLFQNGERQLLAQFEARLSEREQMKSVYLEQLFQKVKAFVEAFRHNDYSRLTRLEPFFSLAWDVNPYTFLRLDVTSYDAARLPGITQGEYNLYLTNFNFRMR